MQPHLPEFSPSFRIPIWLRLLFVFCLLSTIAYGLLFTAPKQFPKNDMVIIPEGVSLDTASTILENRKIIRSKSLFMLFSKLEGTGSIKAGSYLFDSPQNIITVSKRLANGVYGLSTIKVTFPEGTTIKEMAKICAETITTCDEKKFIEIAQQYEGYLFPDTYFFWQSATAEEVVDTMQKTFNQKIATLDKESRILGKPLKDVIIMASILEKEARYFEDRQMVASILWKRIELDMLLQVDASLDYALNKNTYELTLKDLATTSPYNTYKHKGLPPTPIANPGLESIKAALSPKPTKYLFYLTDRSGKFYFAENYKKHLANKNQYMNSN